MTSRTPARFRPSLAMAALAVVAIMRPPVHAQAPAAGTTAFVAHDQHWVIVVSAMVIVGREIAVSALREWMAQLGARAKVAVSSLGKWKTILQMFGLSFMMYRLDLFGLPIYRMGVWLLVIAAALTLWSMVAYLKAAWPELRRTPVT